MCIYNIHLYIIRVYIYIIHIHNTYYIYMCVYIIYIYHTYMYIIYIYIYMSYIYISSLWYIWYPLNIIYIIYYTYYAQYGSDWDFPLPRFFCKKKSGPPVSTMLPSGENFAARTSPDDLRGRYWVTGRGTLW